MGTGSPHAPVPVAMPRTVVLVGLMGAGKTAVGRRLAVRLGLPFVDADHEIETAAGCTIEEYFARHGEVEFRLGERRVIERLLDQPVHVLATGGGAFIDARTRALMHGKVVTVWLRADLDLLVARTARRNNRPLLKQEEIPRDVLERLLATRYPIYAEAEITVDNECWQLDEMVEHVLVAIERHIGLVLAKYPPLPEAKP
ncbi:MAG: shikimate kinase [Rhodospirillaceae bacterium]